MYKYYYIILLVCFSLSCKEQETEKNGFKIYTVKNYIPDIPCELLVQEIRDYNKFEGKVLGFAGLGSSQYNRFQMLCNKASNEDLVQLLNDTNAVVRCYAFLGITERNVFYMQDILKEHLNDTALVESESGCISMKVKVNWVFMSTALPYLNESSKEKYKSTMKDKSMFMFLQ